MQHKLFKALLAGLFLFHNQTLQADLLREGQASFFPATQNLWWPNQKFEDQTSYLKLEAGFTNAINDADLDMFANQQSVEAKLSYASHSKFQLNLWGKPEKISQKLAYQSGDKHYQLSETELDDFELNAQSLEKRFAIGVSLSRINQLERLLVYLQANEKLAFGLGLKQNQNRYQLDTYWQTLDVPSGYQDYLIDRHRYQMNFDLKAKRKQQNWLWFKFKPLPEQQFQVMLEETEIKAFLLLPARSWQYSVDINAKAIDYESKLLLNGVDAGEMELPVDYHFLKFSGLKKSNTLWKTGFHLMASSVKSKQGKGRLSIKQEIDYDYQSTVAAIDALRRISLLYPVHLIPNVSVTNANLTQSNLWQTAIGALSFDVGLGRLKINAVLDVEHNIQSDSSSNVNLKQLDYLALRFSWQKQWKSLVLNYQLGQLVPLRAYYHQQKEEDSLEKARKANLLSDWPEGHQQLLSLTYLF